SATEREICSISASRSGRTDRPTPAARATSSIVRSSWVGPSPPETQHRSCSSPSRSARSRSSGRSPTIVIRAGSSPSDSTWSARNGPFRSVRSPRTSSLPVTTIATRGRLDGTSLDTGYVSLSRPKHGRCGDSGARAGGGDRLRGHEQHPRLRPSDRAVVAVQAQDDVRRVRDLEPELRRLERDGIALLEGALVEDAPGHGA